MQGIRDILDVGGSGAGNKKKGGIQVVDDSTQDTDGVYTLLQLSSLKQRNCHRHPISFLKFNMILMPLLLQRLPLRGLLRLFLLRVLEPGFHPWGLQPWMLAS